MANILNVSMDVDKCSVWVGSDELILTLQNPGPIEVDFDQLSPAVKGTISRDIDRGFIYLSEPGVEKKKEKSLVGDKLNDDIARMAEEVARSINAGDEDEAERLLSIPMTKLLPHLSDKRISQRLITNMLKIENEKENPRSKVIEVLEVCLSKLRSEVNNSILSSTSGARYSTIPRNLDDLGMTDKIEESEQEEVKITFTKEQ